MVDLCSQLNDNVEKYENDANVEILWAIKAAESASIHMNILLAVDSTKLKLNKHQDEVYTRFRQLFPDLDVFKVDENELKNENKEKWRLFCEAFEKTVDDYNFGTMLRIRADGIYDEPNTIITNKVIFIAIEGARNIEGLNEKHKSAYKMLHQQQTVIAAPSASEQSATVS
ncbi:hypothetical protein niasHT_017555 [Heterodera trifolii]|uniref:Polysaccharide biosynthesis domain-containing protein n=1 Tax=Heterodera trifolii TaxID=157864 RepID=A0ABD2L615_9BILA